MFCFVFFSYKTGQALPAYISLNYTGAGQHPNLLTSKVNSRGRQEGHSRPCGFIDSEVLLKMLCFLEVCARPNKKTGQGGAGAGKGDFHPLTCPGPPSDPRKRPPLSSPRRKPSFFLSVHFTWKNTDLLFHAFDMC